MVTSEGDNLLYLEIEETPWGIVVGTYDVCCKFSYDCRYVFFLRFLLDWFYAGCKGIGRGDANRNMIADFATNSVKAVPTMGRCKFDQGLVVSFDQDKAVFSSPPATGYPAFLAQNSQTVSVQNKCDIGVYKKVPSTNDLKFCAGVEDIYGTWQCGDMNVDHTFAPDVNLTQIRDYYLERDLHNASTWTFNGITNRDMIMSEQLIAWSAIFNYTSETAPFHIRVSIDMNITMETPKTMKTFECNLTAPTQESLHGLLAVNANIDLDTAWEEWTPGLNAKVYK